MEMANTYMHNFAEKQIERIFLMVKFEDKKVFI